MAPDEEASRRLCRDLHAGSVAYAARVLLYNSAVSGNCYKVRLLFAHLGLEYETEEVSVVERSNRAELLGELNPGLRVPTLVLDDGRSLGESNAILWYFGDGTQYLPEDPYERAQVLQWQFFEQYSHEPFIAVARFWKAYSGKPEEFERQRERLLAGGYAALDALERGLAEREFLVGDRYSLADISLYAYTHVAHEGDFALSGYPAIRAWLDRVAAQPGHVPIDA
jgi:glutathione S-transferase